MPPRTLFSRRDLVTLASVVVLLISLRSLIMYGLWAVAVAKEADFGLFYFGMRAWLNGGSFYEFTEAAYGLAGDTGIPILDLAPPHFHLLLWPLMGLSAPAAYWLFVAINTVAFGFAIRMVLRETGAMHLWLPATALVLALHAAYGLPLGQYVGLLGLIATIAWRDLRAARWTRAFAWLGVIISVKPFALILLAWAVRARQWRATAAALAVAAVIYGIGGAVFGVDSYREWSAALNVSVETNGAIYDDPSLPSAFQRAFSKNTMFEPVAEAPAVRYAGTLIAVGLLLAITWFAFDGEDVDRSIGIAWMAGFLASPIAWSHYLLIAIAPLIALTVQRRWRYPLLACVVAAGLTVNTWWLGRYPLPPLLHLLAGGWACWCFVALWVLCLRARPARVLQETGRAIS